MNIQQAVNAMKELTDYLANNPIGQLVSMEARGKDLTSYNLSQTDFEFIRKFAAALKALKQFL